MNAVVINAVSADSQPRLSVIRAEKKTARTATTLLLFLTFSALVANPKKLLYTVANPARGLLNREKKSKKKKSGSAPPPPARCSFGEKIYKIKKSRGASTCLGATQVGVTQVVSVRLASIQGFRRLDG